MSTPATPVQELMTLHAMGRYAEMENRARGLLESTPGLAVLHELLGMALAAQQRHGDALASFKAAVRDAPNDPQFWENLGLCQRQLEQLADAEASLRRALALRPRSVETLNALGSVLRTSGRFDEATAVLRQALSLDPKHFGVTVNLGNTLRDFGLPTEAEASYRRASEIDPSNPMPYALLAALFKQTRGDDCGMGDVATALRIVREGGVSKANIATLDAATLALIASGANASATHILRAALAFERTPARMLAAIMPARRVCDWELARVAAAVAAELRYLPAGLARIFSPFRLLVLPEITAADQLAAARAFSERYASPVLPPARSVQRPGEQKSRLRIGYLSGDLRAHPVASLMVGVMEEHDRARFEIVAYDYTVPSEGQFRQRVLKAFDRVVPIRGLSDADAAQRIENDQCDIVVDLTGWTEHSGSAILATRPAPVQAQWLGYPGTMGAPWIDYIIADRVLIPHGEETNFSEKVVRLPDTYQATDDKRTMRLASDRRQHGLAARAFVFCSFNQAFKITPEVFEIWMRLLKSVNGSILWLLHDALAVEPLRRHASDHGVDPQRLVFAPQVPNAEHLERIRHADLGLDCFPYGSHTTASDMLWAGVPLIALRGDTFASRVSSSIVTAAGLPELVTTSLESCFRLALRLATHPAELAHLRERVRTNRNLALFDTRRFTRNLEAAYRSIWNRYATGLSTDHIDMAGESPPTKTTRVAD